jgi:hypothetical protein
MRRWASGLPDAEHPTPETVPADGEALLDRIAAEVVRRGMVTPAVFFLELNRPLAFLAGQATHVLVPFLAPLVGIARMQEVARVLSDPQSIDQLLSRIEGFEREPAREPESSAAA